jgi:hypothetical protein
MQVKYASRHELYPVPKVFDSAAVIAARAVLAVLVRDAAAPVFAAAREIVDVDAVAVLGEAFCVVLGADAVLDTVARALSVRFADAAVLGTVFWVVLAVAAVLDAAAAVSVFWRFTTS